MGNMVLGGNVVFNYINKICFNVCRQITDYVRICMFCVVMPNLEVPQQVRGWQLKPGDMRMAAKCYHKITALNHCLPIS